MQVQQPVGCSRKDQQQGFDNGRKLLSQNGGCHLGHCVAEPARDTSTKNISKDQAERVRLAVE